MLLLVSLFNTTTTTTTTNNNNNNLIYKATHVRNFRGADGSGLRSDVHQIKVYTCSLRHSFICRMYYIVHAVYNK